MDSLPTFSSNEALVAFNMLHVHEYHLAVQALGLGSTYNFVFENILPRVTEMEKMQNKLNLLCARVVHLEKTIKSLTDIKLPPLDVTPRSKPSSPIARRKLKKRVPSPLCNSVDHSNTDVYNKLFDPDTLPAWPMPDYYLNFSASQPPPELPLLEKLQRKIGSALYAISRCSSPVSVDWLYFPTPVADVLHSKIRIDTTTPMARSFGWVRLGTPHLFQNAGYA